MKEILIQWNGFILPAWHTMYVLGAIFAFYILRYLNHHWALKMSKKSLAGLYLSAYFGGYFGARILSILIEQSSEASSTEAMLSLLFSLGPMTFYGGLLGAFLASSIYLKFHSLKMRPIADACVLAGFFALGIGRIGCFLNGDDYGIPVILSPHEQAPWWSVTFPNHSTPIPRVPIQLIESFAVLLGVAIIYCKANRLRAKTKGLLALTCINSYALLRFLLEYLRGDNRGWFIDQSISSSQGISLIVITISATASLFERTKKPSIKSSL